MPHKVKLWLQDAVKGRGSWDGVPLRDSVLLKSDNYPTYHLAVVVDDHDMKISHVMRADEWISTTPIHLLLYEALGWESPIFAHLPNVMGGDGKKLSKRHGATSINVFRDQGYLPEALMNFVALIGWSPGEGDKQEIFTTAELIKKFSLDHVNNSSGVFDYNKLNWMNGIYIRNLSPEEFTCRVRPFIEKAGLSFNIEKWDMIAPHVQERVKLLAEAPEMVEFLFKENITRNVQEMFKKGIDAPKAKEILSLSY